MSRQSWDVVHVQSYHTFVAPLAMLRALTLGIPYVVTFHGGGHSSEARNKVRGLQRALLRPLLKRAQRLVAVARFEIEEYGGELGLPAEKFVLIPNGTDLAFSDSAASNGKPEAAGARLDRQAGALQGSPPGDRRLPLRARARARGEAADRRHRSLRSGPAPQAAELGIEASVEFTSTPPDQPAAMAELLQRVSLSSCSATSRPIPWSRWSRRRPGGACSSPTPAASPSLPPTASPGRSRSTKAPLGSAGRRSKSSPCRRRPSARS